MKLVQISPFVRDTISYPDNVILSFGNRYKSNMERSGWYIRFQWPFPKTATYLCPHEMIEKTGLCYKVFLWTKLPNFLNGGVLKIAVWKPV